MNRRQETDGEREIELHLGSRARPFWSLMRPENLSNAIKIFSGETGAPDIRQEKQLTNKTTKSRANPQILPQLLYGTQ